MNIDDLLVFNLKKFKEIDCRTNALYDLDFFNVG